MNKLLPMLIAGLTLSACMTLPGEDANPNARYSLTGPAHESCSEPTTILHLSINRTGAGLDGNRIAVRDVETGEISYLAGNRWAENSSAMVEQRLAQDLECAGYAVSTSHRRNIALAEMTYELRSLNLVATAAGRQAEFGLSCLYSDNGSSVERPISARSRTKLSGWSSDAAVAAINSAYVDALSALLEQLDSDN